MSKTVQIYLSKSQTEHLEKLIGKKNFNGVDVVGLLMKINDIGYLDMVGMFKEIGERLKEMKPKE